MPGSWTYVSAEENDRISATEMNTSAHSQRALSCNMTWHDRPAFMSYCHCRQSIAFSIRCSKIIILRPTNPYPAKGQNRSMQLALRLSAALALAWCDDRATDSQRVRISRKPSSFELTPRLQSPVHRVHLLQNNRRIASTRISAKCKIFKLNNQTTRY